MNVTTPLKQLLAGLARRRPAAAARPPRARLGMEQLESRLVLDISIQFVGGIQPNVGTPMDPSESAGVIPDSNWNNASGNVAYGAGPLNDQNGNAVSGTSLTYVSNNTWATGIPYAPGDSSLMSGYLDSTNNGTQPTVVVVTGLSGLAPYDIYVYYSGDTHDTRHGFYTVPGLGTQEGLDNAPFDGSTYIQDSAGTGGNYLLFLGGTSDTLVLLANSQNPNDSTDNGFRAPIDGIQIVPEGGPHGHNHDLGHAVLGGLGELPPPPAPAQGHGSVPSNQGSVVAPTGGSLSAAQANALFASTATHDGQFGSPQSVTPGQADSLFADPVQGAF